MNKRNKIIISLGILCLFAIAGVLMLQVLQLNGRIGSIQEIGQTPTNGEAMIIEVQNGFAYVSDTTDDNPGGLMIFDISDPSSPTLVGSYYKTGMPNEIEVRGDLVYLCNSYNGGLQILNVSDPTRIVEVSTYRSNDEVFDIQINGDLAYIAVWENGLEILNISDPSNPLLISSTSLNGVCASVFLTTDLLYVTDHLSDYTNMEVYNVSDPHSPSKVGEFQLDNVDFWRPKIVGDYFFAADHNTSGDMFILDISDPTNISEVARYDSGGSIHGIWIEGTIAYLTDFDKGLLVVDISEITSPKLVCRFDDGGAGKDVQVVDGLIFIADRQDGLEILQYTP